MAVGLAAELDPGMNVERLICEAIGAALWVDEGEQVLVKESDNSLNEVGPNDAERGEGEKGGGWQP